MSFNVTTKSADFLAGTRERSTTYALTAKSPITNEQILEIVNHAGKLTVPNIFPRHHRSESRLPTTFPLIRTKKKQSGILLRRSTSSPSVPLCSLANSECVSTLYSPRQIPHRPQEGAFSSQDEGRA